MQNKLRSITIVGGGSAGWMTAAYLNKVFGKSLKISLVESPNISTVGVGEATFSTIKLFFDFLELDEADWMPECCGSYKLAIKFVNWNAENRTFYHPFQRHEMADGFNLGEWWMKHRDALPAYDYSCFHTSAICDAKRSPRYLDGTVYDSKVQSAFKPDMAYNKNTINNHKIQFPYAYHFNAALLANFLKKMATKAGVNHVSDDVIDIKQAEDGSIASVVTKENGEITGDLFIDCTGFKGMLMNKVLKEPFISFKESLLCDTALAMQVPKDIEKEGMNPYTSATALSSGWVWNIPLYGRDGTGYVFSSAFTSVEDAEKEFRKHVGPASDGCRVNHINMRIGRNRNAWVKNCIGVGLSNGFVEPLESTGIFFIQFGIEELVANFPDRSFNPELVKRYNKNMADCIDGVRDFLTLHYAASSRYDTPFWKATKHDIKLSDELQEYMTEWKTHMPNSRNIPMKYHGFEAYSYSVMLQGLGYVPERAAPVLNQLDSTNALAAFKRMQDRTEHLVNTLPSQYEYLTFVRERQAQMEAEMAFEIAE